MSRKRWMFAMLALALGERFSRAAEHPCECWCIPAIQRNAPAHTNASPTAQTAQHELPCGVFNETIEKTADGLYYEAVKLVVPQAGFDWLGGRGSCRAAGFRLGRSLALPNLTCQIKVGGPLDNARESDRAAEKFATLLEQCPAFHHRDDVVKRLNEIVKRWLDDARASDAGNDMKAGAFVVPAHCSGERVVKMSVNGPRERKLLNTIQETALRNVIEPDMFIWDRETPECPEAWGWLEEMLLDVPSFNLIDAHAIGYYVSDHELLKRVPTDPSRRWFSSPWRQQIIMHLECEVECAPSEVQ